MANLDQVGQRQEARAALDRVEAPEDRVEHVGILGTLLEVDQLGVEHVENLTGLDQEILHDFVVEIDCHRYL